MLALARQSNVGFWTDLARTSLFLLWIGLAGAAVLCWAGPALRRMTVARGSTAVLAIVVVLDCTRLGLHLCARPHDVEPRLGHLGAVPGRRLGILGA